MQSKATTVAEYLSELPADRRAIIEAVRQVILDNLDPGYEEQMQYGMIGYVVPHSIYPPGYHCTPELPLPFACLASQKNYLSLYMLTVYMEDGDEHWFENSWAKTGKKLDMGKSCIRFKKLDDLALNVVAEAIRRMPPKRFIEIYENTLQHQRKSPKKRAEIQRESAQKKAARAGDSTRSPAARKKVSSSRSTKKKAAKKKSRSTR